MFQALMLFRVDLFLTPSSSYGDCRANLLLALFEYENATKLMGMQNWLV
jgi:hypothetical protein